MNYNYPTPQYQMQNPTYKQTLPQYPWGQIAGSVTPQVRPVSSIEEVRACPIDFDGSVFYFADMANKRIYTKQINIDGAASINLYELKEFPLTQPTDQASTTSFVTKEEFETTISQLKNMYEQLLTIPKVKEAEQIPAAQPTTPQFSF